MFLPSCTVTNTMLLYITKTLVLYVTFSRCKVVNIAKGDRYKVGLNTRGPRLRFQSRLHCAASVQCINLRVTV